MFQSFCQFSLHFTAYLQDSANAKKIDNKKKLRRHEMKIYLEKKGKGARPCIAEPQKLGLVKGIYVKRCAPFDSVMPAGGWSDKF